MKRIAVVLLLLAAAPAFAQDRAERVQESPRGIQEIQRGRAPGRGRGITPVDDANAQQTQQRLQELLQQYPPSLRTVLALDPTLLTNDAYLEPYPQLATFIAQHPDIAHNPSYYFQQQLDYISRRNNGGWDDPRVQIIHAVDGALGGIGALIAGLTVIFTIAWIIRQVIEHRKWLRVSKTHVETHAKIMDRLTSNDDLIAYMQSPAGKKFLEAAPIPLEGNRKMLNAPFGRILWSLQAGLVVGALGAGMIYASARLASNDFYSLGSTPLFIIGIAALAVGIGFFVSSFASYGLSARLGLFDRSSDSGTTHVS